MIGGYFKIIHFAVGKLNCKLKYFFYELNNLKMSSTTSERVKNFKSKIPVPVFKVKSFNEYERKRENVPEALRYKSFENQLVKPPSRKFDKVDAQKSQPFQTQLSNKTSVRNCTVSKVPKVKSFKENKSSNMADKDFSSQLHKKVPVKKTVKEETKKVKQLPDKKCESSIASLPPRNVRDIQIEKKLKQNENKLYASENILEKENQEQSGSSDFSSQKDIKFEGNEIFRQMILRGRGLSPSVLAPGFKLSSVTAWRPSVYEVPPDPHAHALETIERMSVAKKDMKFEGNEVFKQMILKGPELTPSVCRLAPGIKLSSVTGRRTSAYEVPPNPHAHALETIERMSSKRGNKKLTVQLEKKSPSPLKVRNSLYTPGVNPEESVMRYLKAIEAKRMQNSDLKSSKKKVTFNFEEVPAKVESSPVPKSIANSEDKLDQIDEASAGNTPSSPVRNYSDANNEEDVNCIKSSKLENLNEHANSTVQNNCHEGTTSLQSGKISEMNILTEKYQNLLRLCDTNNLLIANSDKSPFCSSKKINSASLYRNCNPKLMSDAFNCQKTVPRIVPECTSQSKQRTSKMKLCTPRPVFFSSNKRLLNSCSPDFLEEKKLGNLSNLAPIYTPLVLKNIAKCSAESPESLSPVKLKLDFAATENDSPKKEISGKMKVSSVKKIVTTTKKLDILADKECDYFLSDQNCTVICGRYLRNPVAMTLTEGDEMHFLPIRL